MDTVAQLPVVVGHPDPSCQGRNDVLRRCCWWGKRGATGAGGMGHGAEGAGCACASGAWPRLPAANWVYIGPLRGATEGR